MQLRNRQRFITSLGVAGLGLALLTSMAGSPLAQAQPQHPPVIEHQLLLSEDDVLGLTDEELRDLLIQLLQEREEPGTSETGNVRKHGISDAEGEALRIEAYHAFTQALADELGLTGADAADAAIRAAMMAAVDANTGLSARGAEEQKALIADAEAPIGPAYRGHGG